MDSRHASPSTQSRCSSHTSARFRSTTRAQRPGTNGARSRGWTGTSRTARSGIIGGAALDVMCEEPPDVNSRLLQHPKCIVTPHVAAFSCDFEKNFFAASVKKLEEICGKMG